MTPRVFGFPLWRGKIKNRVAKKYLRRFRNSWLMERRVQSRFAGLGVGGFINDCTMFNGAITEMTPVYRRIGTGRGGVLLDVDFQTANTGCCLGSCGIEPALPRDEVERRFVAFLKSWTLGDSGKKFYEHTHAKEAERAQKIINVIASGGHITDEHGQMLPEYRS